MGFLDKFKGRKNSENNEQDPALKEKETLERVERALNKLQEGNLIMDGKNRVSTYELGNITKFLKEFPKSKVTPEMLGKLAKGVESNLLNASMNGTRTTGYLDGSTRTFNTAPEYKLQADELSKLMIAWGASEDQIPKSGVESLKRDVDDLDESLKRTKRIAKEFTKLIEQKYGKKDAGKTAVENMKGTQPVSEDKMNQYMEDERNKRQRNNF